MEKIAIISLLQYLAASLVIGVLVYYATLLILSDGDTKQSVFETATSSLDELIARATSSDVKSLAGTGTESAIVADETGSEAAASTQAEPVQTDSGQRAVITLAGGCFWCTEAYLQETPGVVSAISGYAGGSASTADYKTVSKGTTEHREAVQVTYDPARISLTDILEIYWKHIDPTDAGGQFADRGFHYTTAIFYHDETQRQVAEASKQALAESGLFAEPIATKIVPYTTFFEAEEYHQDYYLKASAHYERYKKASGRAGFIDDNWAKEAALQFFEQEAASESVSVAPTVRADVYVERDWSQSEIEAALETLPADVYRIVAEEGTEPSFNNKYYNHKAAGLYVDVVTGKPLFSSTHKYESGTGWPAFYRPINEADIIEKTDYKLVLPRTEVRSVSGHLGHVFTDGPDEHGGLRYCINSLALNFVPLSELEARGYGDYLYLF